MLMISRQAMAEEVSGDKDVVHLQIISINDFHGALTESGKRPGAAKLIAYLEQEMTGAQIMQVLLLTCTILAIFFWRYANCFCKSF